MKFNFLKLKKKVNLFHEASVGFLLFVCFCYCFFIEVGGGRGVKLSYIKTKLRVKTTRLRYLVKMTPFIKIFFYKSDKLPYPNIPVTILYLFRLFCFLYYLKINIVIYTIMYTSNMTSE